MRADKEHISHWREGLIDPSLAMSHQNLGHRSKERCNLLYKTMLIHRVYSYFNFGAKQEMIAQTNAASKNMEFSQVPVHSWLQGQYSVPLYV